ncbi:MAG: hypothetical protein IPP73_16855 [Chitinophagaceae bacterium]|nr:hypothetical protein [Chitinophagaceae bacterium]
MKKKIKILNKAANKEVSGFLIHVPVKSDVKDAFLAAGNENLPPPVKLSALNQITANIKSQNNSETDAIDKMIEAESGGDMMQCENLKDVPCDITDLSNDTDAADTDKRSVTETEEDFRE